MMRLRRKKRGRAVEAKGKKGLGEGGAEKKKGTVVYCCKNKLKRDKFLYSQANIMSNLQFTSDQSSATKHRSKVAKVSISAKGHNSQITIQGTLVLETK